MATLEDNFYGIEAPPQTISSSDSTPPISKYYPTQYWQLYSRSNWFRLTNVKGGCKVYADKAIN